MQWRSWFKRFGIRFGISLVVLSTIYGLVFGFSLHRKHPLTPNEKVVVLRTALDQTLIDSNTLLHYSGRDATSADVLTALNSQLDGDSRKLQTALKQAPPSVNHSLRTAIQSVINAQKTENTNFAKASSVLLKPIAYDPESDLQSLDPNHNRDELLTRATGAQNGLKTVANNSSSLDTSANDDLSVQQANQSAGSETLVSSGTKTSLLAASDCFGRLATQLQANQTASTSTTLSSCVKNYQATRTIVTKNLLQDSFSSGYQTALKTTIPDLLKRLDAVIKQT